MTLYRKLIRPMHCYPGQHYEPLTEPVEKEVKWYPEEERECLEKKYASYNEGSFSDLIFEEKYEPYAISLLKEPEIGHWISLENCSNSGVYCSECHTKVFDNYPFKKKFSYFCPHCGTRMEGEIERR